MIKRVEPYNKKLVEFLKEHNDIPMKLLEIKRKLSIRIKQKELLHSLHNLENEGKIVIGQKGVLWIYSNSRKLKRMIKEGLEL